MSLPRLGVAPHRLGQVPHTARVLVCRERSRSPARQDDALDLIALKAQRLFVAQIGDALGNLLYQRRIDQEDLRPAGVARVPATLFVRAANGQALLGPVCADEQGDLHLRRALPQAIAGQGGGIWIFGDKSLDLGLVDFVE